MNTDWSPFPGVMLIDNTAKSIKDHWIAACGVTIKHLTHHTGYIKQKRAREDNQG